jgi:flagella basal body P-ring formation protein FlgA
MRNLLTFRCCFALTAIAFAVDCAAAAELRLRSQCAPAGQVVTLGDIADIGAIDAQQAAVLAAIELFPAPPSPEEKTVRVREIQDLLLLRGVNLAEHQFTGSSEIVVHAAASRPRVAPQRPVSPAEVQRIKHRLCEAIAKYLNERSAGQQDLAVEFELSEANARLFVDSSAPLQVAGGIAPWTGPQQLEIATSGRHGSARVTISATVHVIAPIVVVLHAMGRGDVIRDGDVALQKLASADKLPGTLHAPEQAIGHELLRAVGAGMPVTSDALRQPLSVHRGEVVTVLARSGGIRIRTNARCREDGSVGELVAVESLSNRTAYYARVSGKREVEVFARPQQVENER